MRLIDKDELIYRIKRENPDSFDKVTEWIPADFARLVENAPTIDQWHYPSKGEMPPNNGDYLIYIEYEGKGYTGVGQYFGETGWYMDLYTDLGEVYGYWTPIAWMHLPPPPQEEV